MSSHNEKLFESRVQQAMDTQELLFELRERGLLSFIGDDSFAELLTEAQCNPEGTKKVRDFIAEHAGRRIGE